MRSRTSIVAFTSTASGKSPGAGPNRGSGPSGAGLLHGSRTESTRECRTLTRCVLRRTLLGALQRRGNAAPTPGRSMRRAAGDRPADPPDTLPPPPGDTQMRHPPPPGSWPALAAAVAAAPPRERRPPARPRSPDDRGRGRPQAVPRRPRLGVQIYTCNDRPRRPRLGREHAARRPPRRQRPRDRRPLRRARRGRPRTAAPSSRAAYAGVTVDPTAIPWLLLKRAGPPPGTDGDRLGATTFIQRIATAGGLPPAAADCNAPPPARPRDPLHRRLRVLEGAYP